MTPQRKRSRAKKPLLLPTILEPIEIRRGLKELMVVVKVPKDIGPFGVQVIAMPVTKREKTV